MDHLQYIKRYNILYTHKNNYIIMFAVCIKYIYVYIYICHFTSKKPYQDSSTIILNNEHMITHYSFLVASYIQYLKKCQKTAHLPNNIDK